MSQEIISHISEYQILYSSQLTQKIKKWHDGKLKYYKFNNKIIITNETGIVVGSGFLKNDKLLEKDSWGDEFKAGGLLLTIDSLISQEIRDISNIFKKVKEVPSGTRTVEIKTLSRANTAIQKLPTMSLQQVTRRRVGLSRTSTRRAKPSTVSSQSVTSMYPSSKSTEDPPTLSPNTSTTSITEVKNSRSSTSVQKTANQGFFNSESSESTAVLNTNSIENLNDDSSHSTNHSTNIIKVHDIVETSLAEEEQQRIRTGIHLDVLPLEIPFPHNPNKRDISRQTKTFDLKNHDHGSENELAGSGQKDYINHGRAKGNFEGENKVGEENTPILIKKEEHKYDFQLELEKEEALVAQKLQHESEVLWDEHSNEDPGVFQHYSEGVNDPEYFNEEKATKRRKATVKKKNVLKKVHVNVKPKMTHSNKTTLSTLSQSGSQTCSNDHISQQPILSKTENTLSAIKPKARARRIIRRTREYIPIQISNTTPPKP